MVTEGNYLLLDTPPWSAVRDLADEIWYLDVPEPERLRRLITRHVEYGRTTDGAAERATLGSDADDAELVIDSAAAADLIVEHS